MKSVLKVYSTYLKLQSIDGFKKDDTMNVMSVTKSVTSLLIGIVIDRDLTLEVLGGCKGITNCPVLLGI